MKKLNFYFDFLSPFSYFAWTRHQKNLQNHDLEVTYRPVLMGKLFSHFEFKGPGEIIVKRNYELKKCFRYAHKNQINFCPPSEFPFNPLAIIRCATVSAAGSVQFRVIDTIFKSIWGKGLVLDDPELIEKVFKENNISTSILECSFEKEAKIELKQNIKHAIDAQIFGVPSFQIDNEYFWGNDSFGDLNDYLSGDDNWDKDMYTSLIEK